MNGNLGICVWHGFLFFYHNVYHNVAPSELWILSFHFYHNVAPPELWILQFFFYHTVASAEFWILLLPVGLYHSNSLIIKHRSYSSFRFINTIFDAMNDALKSLN